MRKVLFLSLLVLVIPFSTPLSVNAVSVNVKQPQVLRDSLWFNDSPWGSVAKFKNKMHYLYNIQIQAEIPSDLFISRVTENPKRFPSFRVFLNSA